MSCDFLVLLGTYYFFRNLYKYTFIEANFLLNGLHLVSQVEYSGRALYG